jgi:murein DD-endopeptidase MepM/ murein hydrolase activator NlpD
MNRQAGPPDAMHTIAAFAAGAGCGFLGGALLAGMLVWNYAGARGSASGESAAVEQAIDPQPRTPSSPTPPGAPGADQGSSPVATNGRIPATNPPVEAAISAAPGGDLDDKDLIIPVEGVSTEQLTRTFEDPRGTRRHEALDILAPKHTPVKAVEDGTIAKLFFSKNGGITIYQFDPSSRYAYYYAHLDRYADGLTEGQKVRKGEVIGYVGVSGNAPKDTPHLHFAIFRLTPERRWWEGTPVDPYDVLR